MSNPNVAKILRNPGRLCIGPTDLSLAYPHGGTALGTVSGAAIRTGVKYRDIIAEEYGGAPVETLFVGDAWVLACVLREWDPDAVAQCFPKAAAGTVSQYPIATGGPGNQRAGLITSDRSVVLCFSPDAPDGVGLVLHRAIPMLGEAVEIPLQHAEPMEFLVAFKALPNTSFKSYSFGRLVDITL